MKPPYWLYLETNLEKKYLEQLVQWDYMNRILYENETQLKEAKAILKELQAM